MVQPEPAAPGRPMPHQFRVCKLRATAGRCAVPNGSVRSRGVGPVPLADLLGARVPLDGMRRCGGSRPQCVQLIANLLDLLGPSVFQSPALRAERGAVEAANLVPGLLSLTP